CAKSARCGRAKRASARKRAGHSAVGEDAVKLLPTLLLCAAAALPSTAQAAARFAVVAGNNRGATGRAKLWYAERDAERFARALRELGDFAPERITLLQGARASELRAALQAAEARVAAARKAGERALLVVYFSGHAGAG